MANFTKAKVLDAIARLEKVKNQISKEPKSYYMPTWIVPKHDRHNSLHVTNIPANYCGTVACIAGHLYLNYLEENDILYDDSKYKTDRDSRKIESTAKDLICHNRDNFMCASPLYGTVILFNTGYWPDEYKIKYNSGNITERANIACEMIDIYIVKYLLPLLV